MIVGIFSMDIFFCGFGFLSINELFVSIWWKGMLYLGVSWVYVFWIIGYGILGVFK